MSTRPFSILAATAAFLAIAASASAPAQERQPMDVKTYDVYVDLPTAFAFIKLPVGWKFIGKLDADQLRHLPPDTLTALLAPETPPLRLASQQAASHADAGR